MIMINGQDVVREAAAQASGVTWLLSDGVTVTGTDIAALDSFDVADVGRTVVDPISGDVVRGTAESFFNALISVIARIEVDSRAYTGDLADLMIKDSEWGGFVERVYYQLADIITDPKWNLASNYANGITDYAAAEHGFYPVKAEASVFEEAVPLLTPVSNPVDQLKEACRGEDEMRALINGIRTAVNNTIALGIQSIRHMLAQCAIAVSMAGTLTAVNLLAVYQAETGDTTVTASNWQASEAFQAHALKTIAETRDNLKVFSKAFNDGSVPAFTDDEYSKLILLNKFDKICRFGVKASTFNQQNLALGDYSTTTCWQGYDAGSPQTPFDFASVSKVMIAADATEKLGIGSSAFTADGVVALLFDRYALGISPYKRKVTSQYTAVGDYLNEFHHTLIGTILDRKYPIVAFYIATP